MQSCDPHIAEPLGGKAHIVVPQRIGSTDHDIDPKLRTRVEEYRPSPALAVEDINVESFRYSKVDVLDRLCRTKGKCWSTHIK